MSKKVEPMSPAADQQTAVSRRAVLIATAGVAVTTSARADTLADVAPRELGDPLSARSERSKYVKLSRKLEAGPGARNVDPVDAINSKTPRNPSSAISGTPVKTTIPANLFAADCQKPA